MAECVDINTSSACISPKHVGVLGYASKMRCEKARLFLVES